MGTKKKEKSEINKKSERREEVRLREGN